MTSQAEEGSDPTSHCHNAYFVTDCSTVHHTSLSRQPLMTNAVQTQGKSLLHFAPEGW